MRTETPVPVKLSDYAAYPFAVEEVRLDFQLDASETLVESVMQVTRLDDGHLVLDGIGLDLREIEIDGKALGAEDYILTDETLTLPDVPDSFKLRILVAIHPEKNTALSGLYVSGERLCTQCEADGFRRITYWPDRPDVMSRFQVRLEADKASYPFLLSNGTPGEAGELEGRRHFAVWDDPHPKPSYLFALCAGDYDVFRDSFTTMGGSHVDLAVHVDKGDAGRAAYAMDSLKRSMKWDEDVFGREYDLGVFNIVAVRDFNFGAMENKGLNIFNSAYVLADEATATDFDFEAIESIVAHEYFHNWTGNRITCRDWFQLCLKEGLTVFRDQEFSADMRSRPVQRIKDVIRLRARQFAEDAGPLAHPVRPDTYASVDNLYTATVYEKGAEIIRMLKTLIGEKAFAAGMDLYFERHDGDASTIEDFYACFQTASGRDLGHFRKWYSQPGTPMLTVSEAWDEDAGTLSVNITQANPKTPGNASPEPLLMPLEIAAFGRNGEKLDEARIELSGKSASWTVEGAGHRPLVSINRGFAAPVRLSHTMSDADRLALARIDDDPFNRWEAFQTLITAELLDLAYGDRSGPDAALVDALAGAIIEAARDDAAFATLLARLPSQSELFQARAPADPVALKAARDRFRAALGVQPALYKFAGETLAAPQPAEFRADAEQAGTRALRAALMDLLAARGDSERPRLLALYDAASNMTEQLASLRAIAEVDGGQSDVLDDFYAKWKHQPLVIDKWFQVCAGNVPDAAGAEALLRHEDFDLSNPNRVRAVAGVFAMQNLAAFHAPDGSGYSFLSRLAEQADTRNPALAARLLTAFEQWRSLVQPARGKAEATLRALKAGDLSRNANDIVSRALGD